MQCVYLSLSRCYKEAILNLCKLTGKIYTSINIVGGGCQDMYLNAKTAEYQNTLAAKTEEYQKTLAQVNQRHMDELAAKQEQYAADMAAKTEQYQEKLTAAAQELEAVKRTAEARRLAVIDSAQQIVSDLSSRFDSAALRLRNELDSVAGNMASVSDSFTSAADKLNALRQNGAE